MLYIYQLFIVVGLISVNNKSPLRKQDDVVEMGRQVIGRSGQKT